MTHCLHIHYGFNCSGMVVPGPRLPGKCPSCGAQEGCNRLNDDDELPPFQGERYRDAMYDIHRAALDAATE